MIPCPLCGSQATEPVLTVPEANFSRRIPRFDVVACTDCGTARMDPWPEITDIEELYVHDGVFSAPQVNPNAGHPLAPALERLYSRYGRDLRFIVNECLGSIRHGGAPAILDVGCSTGVLMQSFLEQRSDARVQGIDLDPGAKERALPGLADRIEIGEFTAFRAGEGYDIVTLRFVLEHLLRPISYLDHAVSLLNPGGVLFLAVPDFTSPQARQTGPEWEMMNDPRTKLGHITWYSQRSIDFIAARFGLEVVSCRNRGEALYHLPRGLQAGLRAVLGTERLRNRFIRAYVPRMLNAALIDGLLAQVLGIGDKLYAVLRKP